MDTAKMKPKPAEHKKSFKFAPSSLKFLLSTNTRKQSSSLILFVFAIIIVNLCPLQPDLEPEVTCALLERSHEADIDTQQHCPKQGETFLSAWSRSIKQLSETEASTYGHYLKRCLEFIKLMFTNPMRLNRRTMRYTLADARVLGKMAKMWYIKKKIKKLSKKLKKHTIAVPVFTAIPIYEHSY